MCFTDTMFTIFGEYYNIRKIYLNVTWTFAMHFTQSLEKDGSPKNENTVIIYSFNVNIFLFSVEQEKIYQ